MTTTLHSTWLPSVLLWVVMSFAVADLLHNPQGVQPGQELGLKTAQVMRFLFFPKN